jgi:hypothetical protein
VSLSRYTQQSDYPDFSNKKDKRPSLIESFASTTPAFRVRLTRLVGPFSPQPSFANRAEIASLL